MIAQTMTSVDQSPPKENGKFASRQSEWLKRSFDLVFSILISVLALPVIVVSWCLVRTTSSGPGFYTQTRVGRHGRHYRIYKIRTMTHNCEAATGAAWSHQRDPRVTQIGRVFRKLHIDELPQLLNVLRGDMSLVGPRPERPEFVGPLSQKIPHYEDRLVVKPGVTGLAQIQLPPDQDLESVRNKLELDRCYVQHRSLWLDMRILVGTLPYLIGCSYSLVRRLMYLPNPRPEMTAPRSHLQASHVVGPFQVRGLFPQEPETSITSSLTLNGSPIACSEIQ